MVENSGTSLHADASKPVNAPEPIRVEENASGLPLAVGLKRRLRVMTIEDKWRIDDEWWRVGPVSRFYYNSLLADGQRLVLYKDLVSGEWYRQG
jgi:hypothetical protein